MQYYGNDGGLGNMELQGDEDEEVGRRWYTLYALAPLTLWTLLGYRGRRGDEWRLAWTRTVQDSNPEW